MKRCVCLLLLASHCFGIQQASAQVPSGSTRELGAAAPFVRLGEPSQAIVFGAAFELLVTSETDFDVATLSPLVVELLERKPVGAATLWRFRARCYQLGTVVLPLTLPLQLSVASSLPEPAGELEWPSQGWRIEAKSQSRWLLYGLLALGGVSAWTWWRFLRRATEVAPQAALLAEPSWDPELALRALTTEDGDREPFYQQVKAIVRQHCAMRYKVPADVRTSEELLALLPKANATLQPCLWRCDLILFGGATRSLDMAVTVRDAALRFVAATSRGASSVVEVPA